MQRCRVSEGGRGGDEEEEGEGDFFFFFFFPFSFESVSEVEEGVVDVSFLSGLLAFASALDETLGDLSFVSSSSSSTSSMSEDWTSFKTSS